MSRDDFYKPTDADALRMENELLAFEARFLKTRLAESERTMARLENAKRDKEQQLSAANRDLQEHTSALRQREREVSRLQQQLRKRSREAEKLYRWVEELSLASSALLNSRRWKVGNAFGEAWRKTSLQPAVPIAEDQLRGIIEEFHAWRESHKMENVDSISPYTKE